MLRRGKQPVFVPGDADTGFEPGKQRNENEIVRQIAGFQSEQQDTIASNERVQAFQRSVRHPDRQGALVVVDPARQLVFEERAVRDGQAHRAQILHAKPILDKWGVSANQDAPRLFFGQCEIVVRLQIAWFDEGGERQLVSTHSRMDAGVWQRQQFDLDFWIAAHKVLQGGFEKRKPMLYGSLPMKTVRERL